MKTLRICKLFIMLINYFSLFHNLISLIKRQLTYKIVKNKSLN